jgi:hemerythrin
MANLEWTSALAVGIPLVDDQHKALIRHLNELAVAIAKRQGETEVQATLTFLVDYTHLHFTTEEKHMAATAYPGLAAQKVEHEHFRSLLCTFHEDLEEEGVTKALADSINTLLMRWLTKHICFMDREFGGFLQSRGIVIGAEE